MSGYSSFLGHYEEAAVPSKAEEKASVGERRIRRLISMSPILPHHASVTIATVTQQSQPRCQYTFFTPRHAYACRMTSIFIPSHYWGLPLFPAFLLTKATPKRLFVGNVRSSCPQSP